MDLASHASHCGACGVVCDEPGICVDGACGCPNGGAVCDGACTEILVNEENCGSCGNACASGATCVQGVCDCPGTTKACDGLCVDLQASQHTCGACDNDCLSIEACKAGSCVYGGADGDGCGNPARDIDVVKVALFQAVEALLVQDGELVPPGDRDTVIVAGRDAVVRVFVDPAPSFVPRELSARLTVKTAGESHVLYQRREVAGASTDASVSSAFQFDVPGALLTQDTQFRVDLVECEGIGRGDVGAIRFPTSPSELSPLGVTTTGQVKVVFVPVEHDGALPDTSPEALAIYAAIVEKEFPTTEVAVSFTGAIDSQQNGPNYDFYTGLDVVWEKRAQDHPDPDVYYFGLITPHASYDTFCENGCTVGIAFVASGGISGANERVGLGVGYVDPGAGDTSEHDDRMSYETFLHELGHAHGRDHVDCGDPDGPDPDYPYGPDATPSGPSGTIGTWGFDVLENEPKDPDEYRDFMGYCDPYWVSDYTWNALGARIVDVNGLAARESSGSTEARVVGASGTAAPASVRFRVISMGSSGARWLSVPVEVVPPGVGTESATIVGGDGQELVEVAVHRVLKSEGGGSLVYVPDPAPDWAAVRLADGAVFAFP